MRHHFIMRVGLTLALLLPATLRAQITDSPQPIAENLVRPHTPRLYHDPRLELGFKTHYLSILSGRAFARNDTTISSRMPALDVPGQMGLVNIPVYDASLDLRLSRRNHLTFTYLWGQQTGEGSFSEATGFNDGFYPQTGNADGGVLLESLELGWYYRVLDRGLYPRRLTLDLGAGLRQVRSTISFADEKQESSPGTEVIYAPLVPYLLAHTEWRLNRRFSLAAHLQSSLLNLPLDPGGSADIPLFTDMPADARFNHISLSSEYAFTRTFSLEAGFEYWDLDLHFTGLEDDGNQADNQFAAEMMGGYLGVNVHDPHRAVLSALRRLFR